MRFRSLLAVCAFPLAATGTVYGCSGEPSPEDLCAWLQNPDPESVNCVAEFHEDIKDKCGALAPATVTGTFGTRAALDMCVLTSKGGAVVFDPPIDLVHFPPVIPTTIKIVNPDGTACGEIAYTGKFSWSLKIDAPLSGTGGAGGGSTSTGGSDNESHYTQGTISVANIREQTIQVTCPAPNVVPPGEVAFGETHTFNTNQVLASSEKDGCPRYAEIIPQAIFELDPGGVQRAGALRLKIQFPPKATAATTGAGGGSSTSTGGATTDLIAPEVVYYLDCAIPSAPLICANGIQDASEVDVDCGGPESTPTCPARCFVGQLCIVDCDCDASTTCQIDAKGGGMKKCTAPADGTTPVKGVCGGIICANQVQDSSESDKDCGGVCSPCIDGKKCGKNEDCVSNSCTLGLCGPPTCKDKATNGPETDVDCGGGTCPQCIDGQKCASPTDCMTGGCSMSGVCSSCANTMKDFTETDIDCGGSCAKCDEMKGCKVAKDCKTGICDQTGHCNGCGDGVLNGKESDLDCGGPECPDRCDNGQTCTAATDCTSKGCLNGKCSPCADGLQNGKESDIDCGGDDVGVLLCPRCANGKVCAKTSDCANGTCDGFRCGSCSDGLKDGDETDIDCGGMKCAKCPESKVCETSADCLNKVCDLPPIPDGGVQAPGVCDTCKNMMLDITNETDTDCGGATCPKCVVGLKCKVNLDCVSGICIGKLCQ